MRPRNVKRIFAHDIRVRRNQDIARAGLLCDADILGLGEESKRFLTAFAADTTLFHAAGGDAQVARFDLARRAHLVNARAFLFTASIAGSSRLSRQCELEG